ncbi:MAG: hypothetical protein HUU38_02140 [Anaerolineales bacterium]|nr:hypothetical protein [Anaerolineales bacterium]
MIRLFGRFRLELEGGEPFEIESRKAQELLCYLLIHRNRSHARETLAETIWGESPDSRAKKYLRQALWQVQSAFAAITDPHIPPLILADTEWIQINPEADIWLDVAQLEEADLNARGQHGKDLPQEVYQKVKCATENYHGEMLEGWYEDWCLFERERLQNIYLTLLDKLMGYCEAHHAYEEALAYGERILRYDVARERTHRRMVRIYYLAGERTTALRQYERCVTLLQEELGVKPSQKTVELYEHICQDHIRQLDPPPSAPSVSTPDILSRLHHLEKMVSDFHERVSDEIRTLEQTLKN